MDIISLDIEWTTVVVQLISTLVLFLVVVKFFAQPMKNFLQERQKVIKAEFTKAQDANAEASLLKEQADVELKKMREDANQVLAVANEKANLKYESILADAKEVAYLEVEKAREKMKRERHEMYHDAKKEIAQIATDVTSKLVKKEIDQAVHDDLFDEFVKLVGGADDE